MMNEYKNFLPNDIFKTLKDTMMGDRFPWYFNDVVVSKEDAEKKTHFQFTFTFIRDGKEECWGKWLDIMKPVLKNIKHKKMNRVKANLLTRRDKIIEHQYHIDSVPFSNTTGILYLDNSNGYTIFENGKKVSSEENKYVEFNSTLRHTGSTCTDKMRRMVINFNYER
jgi:hypothetical protein